MRDAPLINANGTKHLKTIDGIQRDSPEGFQTQRGGVKRKLCFSRFHVQAKSEFDWVISFPQGTTTSKSIAVRCRQF